MRVQMTEETLRFWMLNVQARWRQISRPLVRVATAALETVERKKVTSILGMTEARGNAEGLTGSKGLVHAEDVTGGKGIVMAEGSMSLGWRGKHVMGMMRRDVTKSPVTAGDGDVVLPLGARARVTVMISMVFGGVAGML